MNANIIPISTLFIGLNGLVALALSYIVVVERIKTALHITGMVKREKVRS